MSDIDLNAPGVAKFVSSQILQDIDDAALDLGDNGFRNHLGASEIGHLCYRNLWFTFRWAHVEPISGRQARLFERGHLEESRNTKWLKHAGFTVRELDPSTGKQWRVNAVGGHFGGSQDGEVILPPKYNYSKPILLEYKTNGTGATFTKLLEHGVRIAHSKHLDQMDTYGYLKAYDYSLYINTCKNDDNMHVEIIKLDRARGQTLEKKATAVILSQVAPPRYAESQSAQICQYCKFKDVCYGKTPVEKNCRSCKNAVPKDNKEWYCEHWKMTIPPEAIPNGCGDWQAIYGS